jgi:hypothetical protein
MTEQSEAFEPLTSSQHSLATYKNPFGFSLQVVQVAEDIVIGAGVQDAAEVRPFCRCHLCHLTGVFWYSSSCRSLTVKAVYPPGISQISRFRSRSNHFILWTT